MRDTLRNCLRRREEPLTPGGFTCPTLTTSELTTATAHTLHRHLRLLEQERAEALLTGLGDNALYMEDLAHEFEAVRIAYAGAAVTEIASLRAVLHGPLEG